MTHFSLSTKLLEYIHLGIPVIVPSIPTYQSYFPDPTAWYFTPNSVEAATRAIVAFARATPEARIQRARQAQEAYDSKLNPKRDAGVLRGVYSELLGQSAIGDRQSAIT